ncbi:MAG: hypothetical protein ABII90_15195 [Bacteroidota bacterium]
MVKKYLKRDEIGHFTAPMGRLLTSLRSVRNDRSYCGEGNGCGAAFAAPHPFPFQPTLPIIPSVARNLPEHK